MAEATKKAEEAKESADETKRSAEETQRKTAAVAQSSQGDKALHKPAQQKPAAKKTASAEKAASDEEFDTNENNGPNPWATRPNVEVEEPDYDVPEPVEVPDYTDFTQEQTDAAIEAAEKSHKDAEGSDHPIPGITPNPPLGPIQEAWEAEHEAIVQSYTERDERREADEKEQEKIAKDAEKNKKSTKEPVKAKS